MYLWSNKVSPSVISYILQNTDIPLTFFCILFYALFYLALLVLYSPRVLSCVCMVTSSSMISIFSFIEIPPWRFIILYQRGKKISCYIKSLFSTLYTDRIAQIKDTRVRIAGKIRLFFIVKSPMLACVRKFSRKDEIIVAFDDFMARPINNVIKLMLTITTDFRMSCT